MKIDCVTDLEKFEQSLLIPIIDGTMTSTRKAVIPKPKTIVAAIGIKNCACKACRFKRDFF